MNTTFRNWKGKLHKHFKQFANDIGYVRAHPPEEKVFGERDISDWEWLCDNLYTNEAYQVLRCTHIGFVLLNLHAYKLSYSNSIYFRAI